MAVKVRLARAGTRKRPFYRIVVADVRAPRDGSFIERLGHYNPLLKDSNADRLVVNSERIKYWLSVGAQMTERVEKLMGAVGIVEKPAVPNRPKKASPKKKAQERMAAEAEASQATE